jgi:type VI secretion system protein ImpH
LQDYFEVPVRVEQFTGEWFLMNPDTLTSLGDPNLQLGVNTVLWQRIFDPQARFRVSIGPLPFARFRDFLPNGTAYEHLTELTRFFVGDDLNFEVQPLLDPAEVPACALGTDDALRLGWSMWLKTEPLDEVTQPLFEARVAHVS